MNEDLRAWVASVTGTTVTAAEPIGSGASRRIWRVDLEGHEPLVVREDTGAGPVAGTPLTLAREAAVYRALTVTAVPVPRLHAVSPDGRALLLDLVPGTVEVGAADRERASADLGACLAILHDWSADDLDLGPVAGSGDDLALWRSIAEARSGAFATPAAVAGLAWLERSAVAGRPATTLCHGDAGPGNFLHENGAITALLDWEFAHLGDPHDDLAWVAVRNQVLGSPLDLTTTFESWRARASGRTIDRELLEHYRVFVLVRMLVSCDASMAWSDGVESTANRTQARLRPLLGHLVCEAAASAGSPLDDHLASNAATVWKGSPLHVRVGDALDLTDLGAVL